MALLVIAPVWLTLVLLVVAACQVAAEPEKIPSTAKPGGRDRLGETPATALTEAGAQLGAQRRARRGGKGAGMQHVAFARRSPPQARCGAPLLRFW